MNLLNRSVCEWTLLSWVVILICAPSTECIKETVFKNICNIVMERTIKDQSSGPALKVNFTAIPVDANFRIEKGLTARIEHIDLPVYCYTFCSNNCSVQCSEEFSSAGLPMKDYGRREYSIWYSIGLEDICRFHYLKFIVDSRYENSERDKQHWWLLERFPILAMSLLVDGKRGDSTDDVTLTDDTNYTLQLYKYFKYSVPDDLVYNEPFEEVVKLNGGHCRKVVNSTGGERVGNCISVRSIQYQCPTPPAGEDVELTVGEEVVWRRTLSKPVEEVEGLTADDTDLPRTGAILTPKGGDTAVEAEKKVDEEPEGVETHLNKGENAKDDVTSADGSESEDLTKKIDSQSTIASESAVEDAQQVGNIAAKPGNVGTIVTGDIGSDTGSDVSVNSRNEETTDKDVDTFDEGSSADTEKSENGGSDGASAGKSPNDDSTESTDGKSRKKRSAALVGGAVATSIAGAGALAGAAIYILRNASSGGLAEVDGSFETSEAPRTPDREVSSYANDYV